MLFQVFQKPKPRECNLTPGVIVILNPLLGLGVIGVVVGCGMITAGINLIFLSTSIWLW